MSIEAMKWAMEQTIVSNPTDRHVLLVMANNARDDGTAAFPSVYTIASKTGLSERTVKYSIKRLLESGAIRRGNQSIVAAHIKRGDQRPNNYDLDLSRGASDDSDGVHLTTERGASAARRDERGASDDSNGVHLTTERGAPRAPEPSINPTKRQPSKNTAQQAARRADRFDEFWQQYPVKKGKQPALRTWKRKGLDEIADRIIADVMRRSQSDAQWSRGYIPHGSTYVNNEVWNDDIETSQRNNAGNKEGAADRIARLARQADEREARRAHDAQAVGAHGGHLR